MMSSQHALYAWGYKHATMPSTTGLRLCEEKRIPKSWAQFGLQAATRLHEAGVASNRRSANCGEYVPGPCTHRPSRHLSLVHPKSLAEPARDGGAEGVPGEGDEVVTR